MLVSLFAILALGSMAASATPMKRDESHTVTLVNNCGVGNSVFQVAGGAQYAGDGTYTINGPVDGGLAWIQNAYGCGDSDAENCGDVEFTLTNSEGQNLQNGINYSLQQNADQTHTYQYPMAFTVDGCSLTPYTPGQCTGSDQTACPGAFVGTDPSDGTVFQCLADNVGLTVTFC